MGDGIFILRVPNDGHIYSSDGVRFRGDELYLQCLDEWSGRACFTTDITWAARYFDSAHAVSDCERLYRESRGALKPSIYRVVHS